METQWIETWQIHARINLYLLEAIQAEAFNAPAPPKGRSFRQMFAHIHNTRLMWLQSATPELLSGLTKLEQDAPLTREQLKAALTASATAVEEMLVKSFASGKVKGFKPHPFAFIGYMIAHESYHHGEIGIALAQANYPLDKKTAYGMWEWGVR